jgi:V8-like Glu-specific endopeptidase
MGGVENYYDAGNQYPSVVAIDIPGNGMNGQTCSGTLINARTIPTAAHCFYNSGTGAWIGQAARTGARPARSRSASACFRSFQTAQRMLDSHCRVCRSNLRRV